MPSFKIEKLTTRYFYKSGKIMATFEVDQNGKLTYYNGKDSSEVKEYHFELSSPEVVKGIAKMLGQTSKIAEKQIKDTK